MAAQEPVTCLGVPATIVGTNKDDVLLGTPGPDVIAGLNGKDVIHGQGGDDLLCGDEGVDEIRGGEGNDRMDGGNGESRLFGEEGDDHLLGGNGNDLLDGGAGDDLLRGERGNDQIAGGFGLDRLEGGQGDDILDGGGEDDLLTGDSGNDRLTGGAGRDTLLGDDGDDILEGNGYDDLLDGGPGTDTLDGGSGEDICRNGESQTGCELNVENRAPLAIAEAELHAATAYPLRLDGSDSYDPEGALLTYSWTLVQKPPASAVALTQPARPEPFFVADVEGEYLFQLVVSDGTLSSLPAQVSVTVSDDNAPPNARAGHDRFAAVGSAVRLDGRASDDPEGAGLSYTWNFAAVPPGSALTASDLTGRTSRDPRFTPDAEGTYELLLRVGDGQLVDEDTVSVTVFSGNVPPDPDAGPDRAFRPGGEAAVHSPAQDPDGAPTPLRFTWSLIGRPAGSALVTASLLDAGTPAPRFVPDARGAYVLRLKASDGEDHGEDNVVVFVEDVAPSISFLNPADGATLADPRPTLTVVFSDDGSGPSLASYSTKLDGVDYTAATTVTPIGAFYAPASPLPAGEHQATATISDRAGNTSTATVRFTIQGAPAFRAIADCAPQSGAAPLTVRFRSRGEFSGGSIVRYRWDFQGNGAYDTNDPVARDYNFTYTRSGTYMAVLEVRNNLGQIATDTCTIQVTGNAPTATANASPSNGPVPLAVSFTCTATDPDGSVVRYEWDFDGDGTFDASSPSTGSASHTYDQAGEFVARCRVTDNDGKTAEARTSTTVIRSGPPGTPRVTATASPAAGNAPLAISFNGSAVDDGQIVLWEWDFQGDGTWDRSSATSPAASFTYNGAGIFPAALRATDNNGLSSIDNVEIVVNLVATLSIPDDTFDPTAGETAAVNTSLNSPAGVKILLKDTSGAVVRTLVNQARAAGSYSDPWDGRNDTGSLLPHGAYYAVLEHTVGGQTRVVDLTNTTGGLRYNPGRNSLPPVFRPLDDDHLTINFTIPANRGASEVQAFIGLFNVDTRFITLLERVPFGVGTHTIRWDGLNPDGKFAVPPPGDSFLFGIFGFTLPDNAIFLQSAPVISNVKVDPNLFDPSTPNFISPRHPLASVTFDLNKTADVELSVTNLHTGRVIRRIQQLNTSAGTGRAIVWDGHADSGLFADRGDYRLTLRAVDSSGGSSINRYALVRVFY